MRSWRAIGSAALAVGVLAMPLLGPGAAWADARVAASINAYNDSRAKYEDARTTYLSKRTQTLTEYRVVSALYAVANVNLNQAKRNIRDQFRRDVSAADKTYRTALKTARTAAAKAAAYDDWNAAKAAAAVARDADLNGLRTLTPLPVRPPR